MKLKNSTSRFITLTGLFTFIVTYSMGSIERECSIAQNSTLLNRAAVVSRSQWPCSLKAAWLLGSRVRIPLGAWIFVCCVYMLCCPVYVEASATGWSLVQRSPTVYLILCDKETSIKSRTKPKYGLQCHRKENSCYELHVVVRYVGSESRIFFGPSVPDVPVRFNRIDLSSLATNEMGVSRC
jgi:hypothetical protein